MKSKQQEIITPSEWWIQTFTQDIKTSDAYPSPACEYAEHRYLSFLLLLTQLEKQQAKKRVKPVTLFSYDSSKDTQATAIQKVTLRSSSLFGKTKKYNFYESTHLVLTGPLAGTVTDFAELSQYHAYRKRGLKAQTILNAIRPLHNHVQILNNIGNEIALLNSLPHIKQEKLPTHAIELLKQTETLIKESGYIPALIYLLEQLGLDHNAKAIRYNSNQ